MATSNLRSRRVSNAHPRAAAVPGETPLHVRPLEAHTPPRDPHPGMDMGSKTATAMDAPLPPKHERHRLFPCSPTNHKTTYTLPTQPRCKPSRSLHPHPLRQPLPVQTTAQQRKHSGRTSSSIRQRKESHVRQTNALRPLRHQCKRKNTKPPRQRPVQPAHLFYRRHRARLRRVRFLDDPPKKCHPG